MNNIKEKGETNNSPIVEVEKEDQIKKQGNIEEIMNEKLIETREFKKEDLEELSQDEDLIDDSKDV